MAAEGEEENGGDLEASGGGSEASSGRETPDRAALESKVSEGLAAVFGDEAEDDDTGTEEEPAADETDETSAEETEETQEESAEESEKTDDEDTSDNDEEQGAAATPPAKAKKGNAPTLPDAYRRSLKAYEWTDEEIDQNLQALGPKFIETAAKLHANRNAEVSEWAAAGRQAKQQAAQQGQGKEAQQPKEFTAIKPLDTDALKEKYGDDEVIDAIISPVNAVIQQINAMVPAIQATQQKAQVAELEMLGKQVDGFFGGKELEPFTEVYGNTAKARLTDEQVAARNKVLETADALIVGARLQGRNLSLGEALTLAHDSVSGGFKKQAVRKEITNSLKKREKGITLKPGNKNKAPAGGAPVKTRKDLESKVAKGLASVFGR